jgi:uncharacterized phage protein (TIGR01671 family)
VRDLRFRAWDPVKREMFRVFRLTWHGQSRTGYWLQVNIRSEQPNKAYVLMQFTGLQDKDGTEIYEGDLLRITHRRSREHMFLASVEFERGMFRDSCHHLPLGEAITIEVVGNIYENPELANRGG